MVIPQQRVQAALAGTCSPLEKVPSSLEGLQLDLSEDGLRLTHTFDRHGQTGISGLLAKLAADGIELMDLRTSQTSLEEIFVQLVGRSKS